MWFAEEAVIRLVYRKENEMTQTEIEESKDEADETQWLHAVASNPAFDSLNDPEEDIYTLADGKPFHAEEELEEGASTR